MQYHKEGKGNNKHKSVKSAFPTTIDILKCLLLLS